ncbi:hypothetical protein PMIN03_007177 [Paraphaeosphaeria minitans]
MSRLHGVDDAGICGQAMEHRERAIRTAALIWTCKAIASEAMQIFCGVAIIALGFNESPECLRYISSIGGSQVRRINICGRMSATNAPSSESGFTITSTGETFSFRNSCRICSASQSRYRVTSTTAELGACGKRQLRMPKYIRSK